MSAAADIFRQAARQNAQDARRRGNVLHLEGPCELVVSGDIHGNRTNFTKIVDFAALSANPQRILIMQEVIHGPFDANGHDRSGELLLRLARLVTTNPKQVLAILGNHDVAQVTGNEVQKDGQSYCKAFIDGVRFAFADDGEDVLAAMMEFLASMPLAVRTPGGTLVSHSMPSPRRMAAAGTEILSRPSVPQDWKRGGAIYEWTWGRGQSAEQIDAVASELGLSFFVLGHWHAGTGFEVICDRAVSITTEDIQGAIMVFSGDRPLDLPAAQSALRRVIDLRR